jgi:hypothetical protein
MALNLTVAASVIGTHTKSFEGQSPALTVEFVYSQVMSDGVVKDAADIIWMDKDRILNATTEEIDLAGTLTDVFGDAVVFVIVNGIYIFNQQTAAGEDLIVGGAAANAFLLFDDATDQRSIGPGGALFISEPSLAGIPVTAGTGDLLKLDAGATANLKFDILIWGRSA